MQYGLVGLGQSGLSDHRVYLKDGVMVFPSGVDFVEGIGDVVDPIIVLGSVGTEKAGDTAEASVVAA